VNGRLGETAAVTARIDALRAIPRRPGEASFFFHDSRLGGDAVKVLPGEHFVDDGRLVLTTTLGSCVAVCLWDATSGIGGMNHIVLPDGEPDAGGAAGHIGSYAMELLINTLQQRGAERSRLSAKVFGGGAVIAGMQAINIGERNVRFALDYLATERIAVLGHDLLDVHARKVVFWPASGRALVKKLPIARSRDVLARERDAATGLQSRGAGSVDLF
jgi:chemotaxis protein CheD